MENTIKVPQTQQAKAAEITPANYALAQEMATSIIEVESFCKNLETDLKDGLSSGEIIELVLSAPSLAKAVKNLIGSRRQFRKLSESEKLSVIAEISKRINSDGENAASKVEVTLNFAATTSDIVAKLTKLTKDYLKKVKPAKA